jgi:hypothetical protein
MIAELFTTILERNVVFGALIGLESMYVLTRVHQNGTARLWLLLLPLLALASLLSLRPLVPWIYGPVSRDRGCRGRRDLHGRCP